MNELKKMVLEQAQEYNVKFIRLQFTDIFGVLKNIAITVEELPKALEGKMSFDSAVIDGTVNNQEREICLLPDPSTFVIFPWRPREGAVARLICDVLNTDGTPYPCCPRSVLKRVVEEAATMGLKVVVGAETEFFLFHTDERNRPTVFSHDAAGFCDLSPVDLGENARRDMVLTLEAMGFEVSSSHHEFSPGQHEICLKQDNALAMGDKLVTFRFVVRTIAQRHSLHASFMPKPLNDLNGSALHIYQTLFHDQANAFVKRDDEAQLSETGFHYVGGLLKYAPVLTAITNPLINSYKRLVPGDLSPCYVAWSNESRNTMLKVPARRGQETRVELRNPDPACNPYLAIALMLKAGLAGVKAQIKPPTPVNENIFRLTPLERENHQIARLPRNLWEAVQLLKKDELARQTLGVDLLQRYCSAKELEWDKFESKVHQWELDEYLGIY